MRVSCWWSDRPSVLRIQNADGEWEPVDLGAGPDSHKMVTEWATIPGTDLEIREASGPPRMCWHLRPIVIDPT